MEYFNNITPDNTIETLDTLLKTIVDNKDSIENYDIIYLYINLIKQKVLSDPSKVPLLIDHIKSML